MFHAVFLANYDHISNSDIKANYDIAALTRSLLLLLSRELSAKVKLCETLVLSILCYNSETWTLTAETKTAESFEMGCLRRILGVTRRDHISNSDIKAKLQLEDNIVEKIQTSRLRYFGHVTRMDKRRLPYIGRVEGNRAKGRPKKHWLDNYTRL